MTAQERYELQQAIWENEALFREVGIIPTTPNYRKEMRERLRALGIFPHIAGGASAAPIATTRPGMAYPQGAKLAFRQGTDRRLSDLVDSRTWVAGATLAPINLPQVGFLSHLIIRVTGVMNLQNASSYADLGPAALINRIQFVTNISGVLIDLSGYGLGLITRIRRPAYGFDASTWATVFSAPTGPGNNTWNMSFVLPVSLNPWNEMDLGVINLQSDQVRAQVKIICGQNTDAVTALGTGTGFGTSPTISVYYFYWEVPDPNLVSFPLPYVHRWLEDSVPILATGETRYLVPRQGTLLQLLHTIRANGARDTADVTLLRLIFNKSVFPWVQQPWDNLRDFRENYTSDAPVGVYMHDFYYANADPSRSDMRDTIDTDPVATFESGVTLASGTVLGSNNNEIRTVRRFVEPLQT